MSIIAVSVSVPIISSARVKQLEGMFDVAPSKKSERAWSVDIPIHDQTWQIGLVVGPSGSGKSTLAFAAWPGALISGYEWPTDKAVVDGFPAELGIKDITAALSSVGFSTPPAWLRPYRCLSNGEQFRATLARALVDPRPLVVMDEFTSVVDRTVAQVGSAAVAKAVRRQPGRQFIAVTCHADVEEWLCPDWIVEMPEGKFTRRSLRRRPDITLEVRRVGTSMWNLFKHHHYLDTSLHRSAKCFAALWRGRPVAFASVLFYPHPNGGWWREHRTVCLPDFQGVGIGNALSAFVGGVMRATGKKYRSTTGNPAMIRHRAKSSEWKMIRPPTRTSVGANERKSLAAVGNGASRAINRFTASFQFVGSPRFEDARRLGVV